jgi:hypothetical protein
MNKATARALKALAVALLLAPATSYAQLIRGVVRASESKATLDRARITVADTLGKEIGEAQTDGAGRFRLTLKKEGVPFIITVRRLGIKPTMTPVMSMAVNDTSDVELFVEEETTASLDTVQVKAAQMMNERSLREAKRRGWKVIPPAVVEQHRERAVTLRHLLQSTANAGIVIPSSEYGCYRNLRNGNCMAIILDGRPLGTSAITILPSDIYFIAIVPQNDAAIQYGLNHAPFGAIAIYTRQNGDKYR